MFLFIEVNEFSYFTVLSLKLMKGKEFNAKQVKIKSYFKLGRNSYMKRTWDS